MGAGDPVVALHGSGGGLHSFAAVAEQIGDRYEVWGVARRGHAPSNTFEAEVADVAAVLAAAGPAHLLGASTGAILALHTALADPGAVRSLALFEPPLFACGPALLPVLERYRSLVSRGEVADAAMVYASEVARVPEPVLDMLASAGRPEPEEARRAAVGTLSDFEALTADSGDVSRWSGLGMPTLLLQGTETWEPVPTSFEALARALPQAKRVALQGQSHFAFSTAPALVADALLGFYSK